MNDKNKKITKALTAIVAILLCLVLISTSIVSGTLAKFVITKNATTVVNFEKFGVKMQVKNGSVVKSSLDTNSVTVSFDPIELYMGYAGTSAVLFAFDGELTVPATLKVTVDVELDDEVFFISATDFESLPTTGDYRSNAAHMPIKFRVGRVAATTSNALDSSGLTDWLRYDSVSSLESGLESQIYSRLSVYTGIEVPSQSKPYAYKDFSAGSAITLNSSSCGFGLDFTWQDRLTSNDEKNQAYDMIETWIADKISEKQAANSSYVPMKITITVTLEQKSS